MTNRVPASVVSADAFYSFQCAITQQVALCWYWLIKISPFRPLLGNTWVLELWLNSEIFKRLMHIQLRNLDWWFLTEDVYAFWNFDKNPLNIYSWHHELCVLIHGLCRNGVSQMAPLSFVSLCADHYKSFMKLSWLLTSCLTATVLEVMESQDEFFGRKDKGEC